MKHRGDLKPGVEDDVKNVLTASGVSLIGEGRRMERYLYKAVITPCNEGGFEAAIP